MSENVVILVTGDREGYDHDFIRQTLEPYAHVGNVLVTGGARGVDEQARRIWHYDFQLPYAIMPAPWDRVGRAAGPMRNMAMLAGHTLAPHAQLYPDIIHGFHRSIRHSRGTKHCLTEALDDGVERIYLNGEPFEG